MGTRVSRGIDTRYAWSWLAGTCTMMIESARDWSAGFCPGRVSMPTSSMLTGPLMLTWRPAWLPASPSRLFCVTLLFALATSSRYPMSSVPLATISNAPKTTSSFAHNGSRRRFFGGSRSGAAAGGVSVADTSAGTRRLDRGNVWGPGRAAGPPQPHSGVRADRGQPDDEPRLGGQLAGPPLVDAAAPERRLVDQRGDLPGDPVTGLPERGQPGHRGLVPGITRGVRPDCRRGCRERVRPELPDAGVELLVHRAQRVERGPVPAQPARQRGRLDELPQRPAVGAVVVAQPE